uniref:Interleukin family protein n=1 Tax=Falco tinnunculus TaxID=100819 RepID=A0A8C4TPD0_FALTI
SVSGTTESPGMLLWALTFADALEKDNQSSPVYFHLATLYLLCFQTNCSVRDQLLSFYMKNVFSHLGVGSDKFTFVATSSFGFSSLQLPCAPSTRLTSAIKKLKKTFLKLGEKGIYKAIHELDILLPWIQAYIQTVV